MERYLAMKTALTCAVLSLGMACAETEPRTDAGPFADVGMAADAGSVADVGSTVDAGPVTPKPTWADCRHGHLTQTLDLEQRAFCEATYRAPSNRQRLGLRWIFLGHDDATVATYPESQLDDLNTVFAGTNMEFFIESRQRIIDPVATEGSSGNTTFQLSDLMPDLRQFLDLAGGDPSAILDLLKRRLEEQGADLEAGRSSDPDFRLTAGWRARNLHAAVARLHPDLITIVVRQATGEKSTGTYPAGNIKRPFYGMIYLSQITALSALPHEMGHFFGLPHTHGTWPSQPGATQDWKRSTINRITDVEWQQLQTLAGTDYSGDFSDTYLPFDASEETADAMMAGQLVGRKVLGWYELCYQGDFEPIVDDASFIAMVRSDQSPKMKNFVRSTGGNGDFSGNNCRKNFSGEDRRTVFCKYGDDAAHQRLTVADPIVSGSLIFGDNGDQANLMSYISTDTSDGLRRKIHVTERQRHLIRLGARMPSRMRLRNYAE
jgi:hypothetical protein